MTKEIVIASVETLTIWDFYKSREAAEAALPEVKAQCLESAARCKANHEKYGYGDHDPTYWLKQAARDELQSTTYKVMTFGEWEIEEAKQYLSRPLVEVTEEQYNDALECMFPLKYGTNRGLESFFMREFWSGNYTSQYAKISDKIYCKLVDFSKPETWVTPNMVEQLTA